MKIIYKVQGERRFFRVILKYLANNYPEVLERNLIYIPVFGRWDDFYALVDTELEEKAFNTMYKQLQIDIQSKTPSLLAKWLKSINCSSPVSRALGQKTAQYFNLTEKQYRKILTTLRKRINIVERLMSENKWNEIEFDKIPSRAGFLYRNAFAKHEVERYKKFIENKNTKVNAQTLYPCDIVHSVISHTNKMNDIERKSINKYWDNLKDYFNNAVFDGVAVVDTSGSMCAKYYTKGTVNPIDVAISLGMYCAKKCSPNSPFYNHFISFSNKAKLISILGKDFVEQVINIYKKQINESTNIASVFDLILSTAKNNHLPQSEMPKNVVIISDMEFNVCQYLYQYQSKNTQYESEMEKIMQKYTDEGYDIPHLIFWNVDARQDNIPMREKNGITFVSGYSPVIFDMLLSGKSAHDLVMNKLTSDRYKDIY